MICKNPPKRGDGKTSFKGLMEYIKSGDKDEKTLFVASQNMVSTGEDIREFIDEMNALASNNLRCKDPVFHAILSWREGEIPTREQCDQAVKIYLHEMQMDQCEVFYGLHKNTQNLHLHLCINKIDPDTFKTIIPAHGWNKNANEIAARKIEIAQGWAIEESGKFVVIGGEIVKKSDAQEKDSVSDKAADFENLTGEKSAERIAKEIVAPVIFRAENWQQLHHELAKIGVKFLRRGSGGVLKIGDVFVKISSASQRLSFKKLEAKLGAFEEKNELQNIASNDEKTTADYILNVQKTQPIRDGVPDLKIYLDERRKYYQTKKGVQKELKEAAEEESNKCKLRQREERKELWQSRASWKGKGDELNARRSVLAARHALEKDELRARCNALKRKIKEQFGTRFPGYEEWLRKQKKDQEAELWRYRNSLPGILSGEFFVLPVDTPLGHFQSQIRQTKAGKQVVDYIKNEARQVAFTDLGRRISVLDWQDREATLAAMKIAMQKWNSVKVNGGEEFRAMCVELAMQNGIRLHNEDLRQRVEEMIKERREQLEASRKSDSKPLELFRQYHAAVGADRYRVTAIKDIDGEKRTWIVDKKRGGQSNGYAPEELLTKIDWLVSLEERKEENIYYTPISEKMQHILIDDVALENLKRLLADGYKPALAVESSPKNYQVILNVPKPGSEFDRQVANDLTRKLNKEYGDPKLCGAVHPHRAPGFHNLKEKHRRGDGTFPEVNIVAAEARICEKCAKEAKEIAAQYLKSHETRKKEILRSGCVASPEDAYMAHADHILRKYPEPNWNQVDSQIAVRMAVTGYSLTEIERAIAAGAPQIRPENKRHDHDWPAYAKLTAGYIDRPRGQMQIASLGPKYKNYWLRIEEREERARNSKQGPAPELERN